MNWEQAEPHIAEAYNAMPEVRFCVDHLRARIAQLEAENAALRSRLVPEGLDQDELAARAATWSHEQLLTQYMNAANAVYALTQCLAEERERRHKEQPQ